MGIGRSNIRGVDFQLTFTCSKSTIETIGTKCEVGSKLTIKTLEGLQ